jgi:predicted transcriptional regulator
MKSVMISIKPEWCELIASGRKTIEVRKTRPKLETPFKCYIYCTKEFYRKGDGYFQGKYYGKVIGEFVCNKIDRLAVCGYDNRNTELLRVDDNLTAYDLDYDYLNKCQLSLDNLKKYSNGSGLYGWHISDLVIYDNPRELSEFVVNDKMAIKTCRHRIRWGQPESVTQHGGWIKGGYCCTRYSEPVSCEPVFCENYITKPVSRPPQSWCYVEEKK